jgi:predicted transcriptional regulator
MKQNITLRLDKELIRRARMIAVQRSTSISGMLSTELARIVEQAEAYESAKRAALADLAEGFHLGGRPARRAELHER